MVSSKKEDETMTQSNQKKYFQVTAKCGHLGRLRYIPINFAIYAENAHEAAQYAKRLPRVKKQCKDAILACVEITHEEYMALLDANRRESYLKAKCHRQVVIDEDFESRIRTMEGRARKEKRPLSMKYRKWKHEGRYQLAYGEAE